MIKVIEAMLSVLIVLGVLLIISARKTEVRDDNITESMAAALRELAENESARERALLDYNLGESYLAASNAAILREIESQISARTGEGVFVFSATICRLESECALHDDSANGNIYSVERVISSVLSRVEFAPRKIKVYAWRR